MAHIQIGESLKTVKHFVSIIFTFHVLFANSETLINGKIYTNHIRKLILLKRETKMLTIET